MFVAELEIKEDDNKGTESLKLANDDSTVRKF